MRHGLVDIGAIYPPILVHAHLTVECRRLLLKRGPSGGGRKISISISLLLDEAVEGVEIHVLRGSFFVPPRPKSESVKYTNTTF